MLALVLPVAIVLFHGITGACSPQYDATNELTEDKIAPKVACVSRCLSNSLSPLLLAVVAALFFSIAFALGYPVFVTIDAQAQTGFRYTYLYSAWSETLGMTEQNAGVRGS